MTRLPKWESVVTLGLDANSKYPPAWLGPHRSSLKGTPSIVSAPRPICSIAALMRPPRPSSRSAIAMMRLLGVAVGDALRSARASSSSSRPGASAAATV